MGLERSRIVAERLGLRFTVPVVTVGGTNGKGSTCAMLEAILLAAGYRVGLYIKPHFLHFNERARIGGEDASDTALIEQFEAVEAARTQSPMVALTYYEFTTLAILRLLAHAPLDVVILEVGLGGRLDTVNLIDADCAVVTSIAIDHVEYLGTTREEIGFEKAGIFRSGKPAICADPEPPASLVEYAERIGADLWRIGRDFNFVGDKLQWNFAARGQRRSGLAYPALRGANQLLNASAALAALSALRDRLPVAQQAVRSGLMSVELAGRFQVLPGRPTVIYDVAHNPHAAAALAHNLDAMGYFPSTLAVFGAMRDKDIPGILRVMVGRVDHWFMTTLPTPRAAHADELAAALNEIDASAAEDNERSVRRLATPADAWRAARLNEIDASAAEGNERSVRRLATPADAWRAARGRAGDDDRIVVFGSFYTVAGVMGAQSEFSHP